MRLWTRRAPAAKAGEAQDGEPDAALLVAQRVKGFLSHEEGLELYELARRSASLAPCLEIGSYCGKSTIYLAAGCREAGCGTVFAVDHHRGSSEQQRDQPYFDPELDDDQLGVYTLDPFVRNLEAAGLTEWVVPIVCSSERLARLWPGVELGLLFIDGGHGEEDVRTDVASWAPRVVSGGYLCMHDIYASPAEGGQAPRLAFEEVCADSGWQRVGLVGSLGVASKR